MKRLLLGLLSIPLLLLLLLNLRLHRPGGPDTVRAQLRYLEGALGQGAAEDMQMEFPEGYVFTWALYGLASARHATSLEPGDADGAHLLRETARALAAIRSDAGRKVFVPEMDPPYGAFYASWLLYTQAEYVRSAGPANVPPGVLREFTAGCDRFAAALARYPSPFLESYPEQVWPADTAPGVAALAIHDALVAPRYGDAVRRWVTGARAHLDPRLGVLSHAAEPVSGDAAGGVRGESLALLARLLVDVDPAFAREQYAVLRERFLHRVLGVPGFLEYPRGVRGAPDLDTGPLVFGYSGPAIVMGAAAARTHGDATLADAVLGGVEVVGVPVQLGRKRVYAGGALPVGDAFIAWARTSPVGAGGGWEPFPATWSLPFHALSGLIAALLIWWGWRIVHPRPRRRPFTSK